MKQILSYLYLIFLAHTPLGIHAETISDSITVSTLKALAEYASKDGQVIQLKPGLYKLTDYLTPDSIAARKERKEFPYINFSGSNNVFKLEGVEIELDTEIRNALKPPIHSNEFVISGSNNTFNGLKITCINNGTSPGGALLQVAGKGNSVCGFNCLVRGSYPYGYGDLFGKGGPDVIRHQKHSGILVTGSDTKLYDCTLIMRSFGHGFFIQQNAENIYFENCSVEGEVRSTDEVLKETSGPAFDVAFRTWTKNREGKYRVTPGYMKSLCEDGFRTYGEIKNVRFINCTAKSTRGGFELRTNGGIYIENCTVTGVERGYWVGNRAVIKNSKGDAAYGPLLFVEGSNVSVELTVIPTKTGRLVHALATIQGNNNHVEFKEGKAKSSKLSPPIMVGYTHPEHGEAMSPYSEGVTAALYLKNETAIPVVIGEKTVGGTVITKGQVQENKGNNTEVKKL